MDAELYQRMNTMFGPKGWGYRMISCRRSQFFSPKSDWEVWVEVHFARSTIVRHAMGVGKTQQEALDLALTDICTGIVQ